MFFDMEAQHQIIFNMTPDEFRDMINEGIDRAIKLSHEDRLLSRKEVMQITGRSVQTIIRMVRSGRLMEQRTGKSHPKYLYSEVIKLKH